MIFHCCFNVLFPDKCCNILKFLLTIWISSFIKCFFQLVFWIFFFCVAFFFFLVFGFSWMAAFYLSICGRFSHILDRCCFLVTCMKIFPLTHGLHFHFFSGVFWEAEMFNFSKFACINILFILRTFCVLLKKTVLG